MSRRDRDWTIVAINYRDPYPVDDRHPGGCEHRCEHYVVDEPPEVRCGGRRPALARSGPRPAGQPARGPLLPPQLRRPGPRAPGGRQGDLVTDWEPLWLSLGAAATLALGLGLSAVAFLLTWTLLLAIAGTWVMHRG